MYTWTLVEVYNPLILDNFIYTWSLVWDSPISLMSIYDKQWNFEYSYELMNHSDKFNLINQNLFEIKIWIFIIIFLILIWFSYSLISSFIWKKL